MKSNAWAAALKALQKPEKLYVSPSAATNGMLEPGTVDLNRRSVVRNKDGTISTVRSMGVNLDGQEILLPTVSPDGKILQPREAVDLYRKTGQHLGVFKSPEASNAYAQMLHEDQAKQYKDE